MSTTSTTTSAPTSTTSVPPVEPTADGAISCRPARIVVLGNSTDFWPAFDGDRDAPSDDAWPALAGRLLDRLPVLDDIEVEVVNASVLGAGFDIGLYGVTSMADRLREFAAVGDLPGDVLVLVPSVVDLQLRRRDVDASFAAFEALHDVAEVGAGLVLVPPMNPVGARQDTALVEAIADFNVRLAAGGYLDPAYRTSPLSVVGSDVGADEFYDDFDDDREPTAGPDPDWLHPDRDGHRAIAEGIAPWLSSRVRDACAG